MQAHKLPNASVIVKELVGDLPTWTMAVDPGETCGVALTTRGRAVKHGDSISDHLLAVTLDPDAAHDRFAAFCLQATQAGARPTLRIEEYRIYPDKLKAHSGKTIPTAECIGAFKYIARRMGATVHEQPASIKQTTAAMLRTRGIPLSGGSRHAMDAELHMWFPILHSKYKAPTGRKRAS